MQSLIRMEKRLLQEIMRFPALKEDMSKAYLNCHTDITSRMMN